MKTFFLSLCFSLLFANALDACRCVILTEFGQTLDQNDQIFIGKVLSKFTVSDSVKFHFNVQKKWKGKLESNKEVIISTSTGSCGMEFEIGETYIVYAKKGFTNICRRNKKLSESFDERLLDHYFFGESIESTLDKKDTDILRAKLKLPKPENTEQSELLVLYDYRVLSPKEIYSMNPLNFREGKYMLLQLSNEVF